MKLFLFLLTLSAATSQASSSVLKSDPSAINQKLSIDFTKSDLVDLSTSQVYTTLKDDMERVAMDFAEKNHGKMTGISFALNPINENKEYSYFFTFNIDRINNLVGSKNCMAIVDRDFTKYSAACYHIIK